MKLGDFVGSTTAIIKYCKESECQEFIVGTEDGTGYQLRLDSPDKTVPFCNQILGLPEYESEQFEENGYDVWKRCSRKFMFRQHVADQSKSYP